LAVCTIARWIRRWLLRFDRLLGDRELAADLLRLGDDRHATQERQDRELGPGLDLLDRSLGEQVGGRRRRQLVQHGAAVDATGVAEDAGLAKNC
jgi:hypothetical protein